MLHRAPCPWDRSELLTWACSRQGKPSVFRGDRQQPVCCTARLTAPRWRLGGQGVAETRPVV